jgi:hypothetical protein
MGSDSSVSHAGWRVDDVVIYGPCSAPVVTSAVSRKSHGAAGTFDIPLPQVPLNGAVGIEDRVGAVSGAHQIVVTFANNVTVGSVAVTSGTGAATFGVAGAVVTIDLTGVTDAQRLAVTLSNVSDGGSSGNVVIPMGVLAGDSNASGSVTGSDVSQVKAAAGTTSAANFRSDVNANGTINATDISIVKSRSGAVLPP